MRYVAYVMLLTQRDLNLENTGYMGLNRLTGFRLRTYMWFNMYERPCDLRKLCPGGCCYMCMLYPIYSKLLTCCFKVVF